MIVQPVTPIIVRIVDKPSAVVTLGNVIVRALGLSGALFLGAILVGLILGGLLILARKFPFRATLT